MRLAVCGACQAKHWLSSDLPLLEPVSCTKCGHPVVVPTRLRNFEVREVVASGGMGTVYRAFDVQLERMVAIKMLKREMAEDKQVMESFYREARATAALNHTNIIHVYSFDEHEGSPYIVMELADHGSLDAWIIRDGVVPELNVLDLGIKVASALDSTSSSTSTANRNWWTLDSPARRPITRSTAPPFGERPITSLRKRSSARARIFIPTCTAWAAPFTTP